LPKQEILEEKLRFAIASAKEKYARLEQFSSINKEKDE